MTSPHDADLYADLGLTPKAGPAEITRAYRDLLRRHHPDTRPHQPYPGPNAAPSPAPAADSDASGSRLAASSDEVLNRALAAYAVLADPKRRARYDHQQGLHRADSEPHTHVDAAGPRPPTRPTAGPVWPAAGATLESPRQAPPQIRVSPVRWHRVSPTTGRRP